MKLRSHQKNRLSDKSNQYRSLLETLYELKLSKCYRTKLMNPPTQGNKKEAMEYSQFY